MRHHRTRKTITRVIRPLARLLAIVKRRRNTHKALSDTTIEKSRKKRVIIAGGSGWLNIGDDLITQQLVAELREQWPSIKIAIIGGNNQRAAIIDNVQYLALSRRPVPAIRLIIKISRSDTVIIGGGGLLVERGERRYYRAFYRIAMVSRILGTPFALVAVGVRPAQTPRAKAAYNWLIKHAAYCSVRDYGSADAVYRDTGRVVRVTEDPAFRAVFVTSRARDDEGVLAANIRPWWHLNEVWEATATRSQSWDNFITELAHEVNSAKRVKKIVLVPMVLGGTDSDIRVLEDLRSLLSFGSTMATVRTWQDVARAFGSSRALVAMRLHAAILGFVTATPTVAIAYDAKVEAVLRGRLGVQVESMESLAGLAARIDDLLLQGHPAGARCVPTSLPADLLAISELLLKSGLRKRRVSSEVA